MIKKIVKKFFAQEQINNIKAYKNYLKSLFVRGKKIEISSNDIKDIYLVKNKNGHIFCGYFDINPNNPNNNEEIIAGMLTKKAVCGKDPMTIAIVNYKTNEIKKLVQTNAWNWQMGSRIRWSKIQNIIIYNDFYKNHYCTIFFDITKMKIEKIVDYALYDISKDETFGLSVNFSRLQRLRPGYGYSNTNDETLNDNAPHNDGLFYIDLEKNTSKLLVSLDELSSLLPESKNHQSYINHVSISPNNDKATFFYIWKIDEKPGWKATLCVIDLKINQIKCLENIDQVSHYDWKDNETVLITGVSKKNKECFYRLYNVKSGEYKTINNSNLKKDGHPVFSSRINGFYSDTYPNQAFKQTFFKYENDKYFPLVKLYHDPRMYAEKRCDLHPHYFNSEEIVALDTTFKGNRRQILIVRLKHE